MEFYLSRYLKKEDKAKGVNLPATRPPGKTTAAFFL